MPKTQGKPKAFACEYREYDFVARIEVEGEKAEIVELRGPCARLRDVAKEVLP